MEKMLSPQEPSDAVSEELQEQIEETYLNSSCTGEHTPVVIKFTYVCYIKLMDERCLMFYSDGSSKI